MNVRGAVTPAWLVLITLAACSDTSQPGEDVFPATVEYAARSADLDVEPPPLYHGSARIIVDGPSLTITTKFFGDLCRVMPTAALTRAGKQLVLTVKLVARPDAAARTCLQWVAETDVTATTTALPAGVYTVVARVAYPTRGQSYSYAAGTATIE